MENTPSAMKGQLLSAELVLAFSLFVAALVVFLLSWSYISYTYSSDEADSQMQSALIGISDSLVLSPGDPADWELTAQENANSFGLASSKNVLSAQKLSVLQSLNSSSYDTVREAMGAGRYQLYIELRSTNGTAIYRFGNPANQQNDSVSAVTAERIAILGDSVVNLRVQLWRQKGSFI